MGCLKYFSCYIVMCVAFKSCLTLNIYIKTKQKTTVMYIILRSLVWAACLAFVCFVASFKSH